MRAPARRVMLPRSVSSSPLMARSRLDLPLPFGPTRPTRSRGPIAQDRSWKIVRPAYPTAIPLSDTTCTAGGSLG